MALFVAVLAAVRCGNPEALETRLQGLFADSELSPNDVQQALSRELRAAPVPAREGETAPDDATFPTRRTLTDFYRTHGHRLAWSDTSGKILPRARILLDTLRRADTHGLVPVDYALDQLEPLEARIDEGSVDETQLADFDVLMTASFFRYASDVSTGRVHPEEVRGEWHANASTLDLVDSLNRVLEGEDLAAVLESLPPPHAGYARLLEALKTLRDIETQGGWPVVSNGPKLEPGVSGPRVVALRRRLAESGAPETTAGMLDRFDPALAESVRGFQERHGIEADGKVGDDTLAELNVPVGQRIRQVELNLERWRWIPRGLGDSCVVVNIPGFGLELIRDGAPVWRTRIVVGKAYTPTPVFSDRIVGVVINPPWNVPESIAVGEYLPELRQDPRALDRLGLRLLEGSGDEAREVDPATIDWSDVDEERFPYRLRQDPGPENALGRLKFELTNDFQIYLHDTPAGHLFGRTDRGLSHGCIRVERPLELAEQILGDSALESFREALDQAEELRLPVEPPMPVHVLYWTAWVDEAGLLHFGPDVYGIDEAQTAAAGGSPGRSSR